MCVERERINEVRERKYACIKAHAHKKALRKRQKYYATQLIYKFYT